MLENLEDLKDFEDMLAIAISKTLLNLILLFIALTYKHYRIAMDKMLTYVKRLEIELNSLYPESNLFNRETNFSSAETRDFAMWSSNNYSRLLKFGCIILILTYVVSSIVPPNTIDTIVGLFMIVLCFFAEVFFH